MIPALPLQNGGTGVLLLLFWVILVVAYIALTFWVYQDAETNSEHPAILWAIVVFLAPLLGLVLYVLLGRNGGAGGSHGGSGI